MAPGETGGTVAAECQGRRHEQVPSPCHRTPGRPDDFRVRCFQWNSLVFVHKTVSLGESSARN